TRITPAVVGREAPGRVRAARCLLSNLPASTDSARPWGPWTAPHLADSRPYPAFGVPTPIGPVPTREGVSSSGGRFLVVVLVGFRQDGRPVVGPELPAVGGAPEHVRGDDQLAHERAERAAVLGGAAA